jgi:hypothetical protein
MVLACILVVHYKQTDAIIWPFSPAPMTPIVAFERLFFSVFGLTSPDDLITQPDSRPEWTQSLFKILFGLYMLVSVIVLINLLIAMMSDTYQRIQVNDTNIFLFFFVFSFLLTSVCTPQLAAC